MTRYLYLVLAAALLFVAAPVSNVNACDDLCLEQKRAKVVGRVKYDGPLICVHFMQEGTQNVVVQFYDEKGKLIGPINGKPFSFTAKAIDNFCFNPTRFKGVAKIEICNDGHNAWIIGEQVSLVISRGKTPAPLCLLGSEKCKQLRKVGSLGTVQEIIKARAKTRALIYFK